MKKPDYSELTNSRSQVLEYLSCGYRWDLSYRRGIQSTHIRDAMDGGSAVHMGIKFAVHRYASGAKIKKWFEPVQRGVEEWAKNEREIRGQYLTDEQRTQIHDIQVESVGIALKALEFIDLPSWEVMKFKGQPVCEMEFRAPLPPWAGYRTIPDLVARPIESRRLSNRPWWLIDWKCRSSFDEDDAEDINLQFSSMQYVLKQHIADPIAGSILWQIKSQAPRRPTQNKNGEMSRAAIVTDWETYRAALVDAKLDPADYEDMKQKLEQVEWFRALKQHRTDEECKQIWANIVYPASKAMTTNPQIIRRYTHTPFACRGCWARQFCLAELREEDTDFLLETDYMDTRKPRKARDLGEPRRQFTLT